MRIRRGQSSSGPECEGHLQNVCRLQAEPQQAVHWPCPWGRQEDSFPNTPQRTVFASQRPQGGEANGGARGRLVRKPGGLCLNRSLRKLRPLSLAYRVHSKPITNTYQDQMSPLACSGYALSTPTEDLYHTRQTLCQTQRRPRFAQIRARIGPTSW